jgi:hypothetical protein
MKLALAILIMFISWIAWELYRAPHIQDDGEDRSAYNPHPPPHNPHALDKD